jgi:hypothetical protein
MPTLSPGMELVNIFSRVPHIKLMKLLNPSLSQRSGGFRAHGRET